MPLTRREFMVGCSAAIAGLAGGSIGGLVFAAPDESTTRDILVFLFLRGGCDGLGIVSPLDSAEFNVARSGISFPSSGTGAGLSLGNLSGEPFWLHPKAGALKEIYDNQKLAIIHACGLTNGTRSHFDAMDYMERGTPNNKHTSSGWLTRHLSSISATGTLPALAANTNMPASLLGSTQAIASNNLQNYKLSGYTKYAPQQETALRSWYAGSTPLQNAGLRTLQSIAAVQGSQPGPYVPDVDYPSEAYVSGLSNSLKAVAQMIKLDLGLQVATIDFGGWDTHENQSTYLNNQIDGLSRTIAAFYNDLAAYHSRLTVVVMSEFGRRLKANKSAGTDHGHGNIAMVLGGNVNGGRLYGSWPGLLNNQLDNGVDLAITTDYRTILSEVVVRRLANPQLGIVFPELTTYNPLGIVGGTDLPIDFTGASKRYLPLVRR